MKGLTYLLVDLASLAIPLVFTFHPRIRFDKVWRPYFLANLIVIMPFLLWDVLFTKYGIWGFNTDYLCGINIFGLPLEEYLFFICIPYACLFTYFSIKKLWTFQFISSSSHIISYLLMFLSLLLSIMNYDKAYTFSTFSLLTLAMFFIIQFKAIWINHFYFSYLILLFPFFITNGILTGTGLEDPIVWYNDEHNLGLRISTIPVEDIFYGMLLILGIVSLFEFYENRLKRI